MTWKAEIEGHHHDLETLGRLFNAGDPIVTQTATGDYYLESTVLQDAKGQVDCDAARALVKRINGIARAADLGFQPVKLTDRYMTPEGSVTIALATATAMIRVKALAVATVLDSNGVLIVDPPAPPKGPRYAKLAESDVNVADALRVLGSPESLDWYDIYKAWEIVETSVGGRRQVVKRGWATKENIDRLTASANHPGISGDEARHARMGGTPGANRVMTVREADNLVRQLVANWIESHPTY